jgi:hypothetical protein
VPKQVPDATVLPQDATVRFLACCAHLDVCARALSDGAAPQRSPPRPLPCPVPCSPLLTPLSTVPVQQRSGSGGDGDAAPDCAGSTTPACALQCAATGATRLRKLVLRHLASRKVLEESEGAKPALTSKQAFARALQDTWQQTDAEIEAMLGVRQRCAAMRTSDTCVSSRSEDDRLFVPDMSDTLFVIAMLNRSDTYAGPGLPAI